MRKRLHDARVKLREFLQQHIPSGSQLMTSLCDDVELFVDGELPAEEAEAVPAPPPGLR